MIENEDLRQLSIGFSENTYTIERKDNDELHLKHTDVYLHEFSLVTWGRNEEALIIKNRSNTNILNTIREFGKEKIIEVLNAMTNTDNTEKNKAKENKEEKEAMTNPQFRFTPLQKKENKKFNLKKLKKMGKIIELNKELTLMTDLQGDVNKKMSTLSSDTLPFDKVVTSVNMAASGMQIYTAAMDLAGVSQKVMKKQ